MWKPLLRIVAGAVFLVASPAWSTAQTARSTGAIDPVSPSILYAASEGSVLRSDDSGVTWSVVASGLPGFHAILAIGSPTVLYATSDSGVFRSRNRGVTWTPIDTGLTDLRTFDLSASRRDPRRVHVSTGSGIFTSSDEGDTWTPASGISGTTPLSAIASAPSDPDVVYAASGTPLFRSSDGGNVFVPTGASFPVGEKGAALSVDVDPVDSATVVVLDDIVGGGPRQLFHVYQIFLSRDAGRTFTRLVVPNDAFIFGVLFDRTSNLYLATGSALIASADYGATWRIVLERSVVALTTSLTSARILADTWLSDDQGSTWTQFSIPPCLGRRVTLCLGDGRFLAGVQAFVNGSSIEGRSVPMTRDAGAFWLFSDNNIEIVMKVVDGRAVNGHYWLFVASLTDVSFTLIVHDTVANTSQSYIGYPGNPRSFMDLTAFGDPP